jgi:methylenetetrahydrofolate dehydrogenase (NADP+)/methenyltetrahydrofolate cyclohydrolase
MASPTEQLALLHYGSGTRRCLLILPKYGTLSNAMKMLNGSDLASFIVERQARQVRALRQAHNVAPRLAVILTDDNPASLKYISVKQRYGADILVDVVVEKVTMATVVEVIERHNQDVETHGIIVQLPIADMARTDEIVAAITPEKDVDGLNASSDFDPATPTAILWLLAGYNIDLRGKQVVIIGKGRLVGGPLAAMLEASGVTPLVIEKGDNLETAVAHADIIISAAGDPGVVTADMLPQKAIVVDAGVAGEGGVLKGDVADDVYETRDDLIITPKKGGVGPLTVTVLFDNVIRAAQAVVAKR